jgi:hypothetical protein
MTEATKKSGHFVRPHTASAATMTATFPTASFREHSQTERTLASLRIEPLGDAKACCGYVCFTRESRGFPLWTKSRSDISEAFSPMS